ncbi:MAG TPA: TlpA disulfide reductase family protein [Vicinamibacterales bacterium]|nr:TlpA disulfide reductase family protein [Vicinamibacterales bacterium]
MVRRLWTNRWLRATAVAAVIAMVPAYLVFTSAAPEVQGEFAPLSFTLKDMDGADVNLADFKGRPLIINFWATWCGPCKHEIPAFVELVDRYKDQGFTVLGVSVDDAPEDLKPFAAEYKINYPVLVGLGHDDLQEAYGAHIIVPVSWFVRRDGTVHLKWMGTNSTEWFEEQVKALLAD